MSRGLPDIIQSVCARFRVFGGGVIRGGITPVSVVTQNGPPIFALGVDVEEVVRFVLAEAGVSAADGRPSTPVQLTPEKLQDAASLLYGQNWRTSLAGVLDISERTIRRWANGSSPIPYGVSEDIADLCRARTRRLLALQNELLGRTGDIDGKHRTEGAGPARAA